MANLMAASPWPRAPHAAKCRPPYLYDTAATHHKTQLCPRSNRTPAQHTSPKISTYKSRGKRFPCWN